MRASFVMGAVLWLAGCATTPQPQTWRCEGGATLQVVPDGEVLNLHTSLGKYRFERDGQQWRSDILVWKDEGQAGHRLLLEGQDKLTGCRPER